MRKLSTKPALAAVLLMGLDALALPAPMALDAAHSTLGVRFTQMNVPVDASFEKLSGQIAFDPAHPEQSKASIQVLTDSFDLGDADYNSEVQKPEWLAVKAFPAAAFVSSSIRPMPSGQFQVTGVLHLKGRNQTLSFPVSMKEEAIARVFDGSVAISRKAFAIGDANWNEVLADSVSLQFHFVQPR